MKKPPAFTLANTLAYVAFLALTAFLGWEAAANERWLLLVAIGMAAVWATLLVFQPGRRGLED